MNRTLLKQARFGYKKLIQESPTTITLRRLPLVDDGFGGFVEDPLGIPLETSKTVRIAHERAIISKVGESPSGLQTDLSRYLLWEHNVDIRENDTFDEIQGYRVGKPDPLKKFGGIYGYQAPLIEGN